MLLCWNIYGYPLWARLCGTWGFIDDKIQSQPCRITVWSGRGTQIIREQFEKCYGGVEEGVTNSVQWVERFTEEMTFVI